MSLELVRIHDLRYRYQGQSRDVLSVENLSLDRGKSLFLEGPSGSGKSTLLNLIAGVLTPQQGKVEVLGKDLSTLSSGQRDCWRGDHMGFVFQMFNLVPYLTVLENLTLPLRFSPLRRQRVEDAGGLASQTDYLLDHLQLDDRGIKNKKVNELSVGQQQRVAVARALMGRPELIIADEPTSALDADARKAFLHLLFHECQEAGAGLLFVSHDSSLSPGFDKVLNLRQVNRAFSGGK